MNMSFIISDYDKIKKKHAGGFRKLIFVIFLAA